MPLGTALFLTALLLVGIFVLTFSFRRRREQKWMLPLIVVLSAALLALIVYTVLTYIFIDAVNDRPPAETSVSVPETTVRPTQTSVPETFTTPTTLTSPTTPVSSQVNIIDPEREADPSQHPDVLGLRDLFYQETPTFAGQNEVTKYILHKFLNDDFNFSFYIREEFYFDEDLEKDIVFAACETAMSYYLFSAYEIIDMYVEYDELNSKFLATVKLEYKEPEYDQEAREAAVEFLRNNPVPGSGFTDFENEKAYARKIHDFIARRITYAPIGYDPESLTYLEHYDAYQEAYNALAAPDYTAVCAGYARGFALIAQYAGINAAYVYGNEDEDLSHAWNMIYPCDGREPVLVDMTWNDTYSDDVPGQEYVYDYYFYLSLDDDYEHFPEAYYADFLQYINR